jgi:uncharacterized protein YndB with AHSA1/START domain
VTAVTHHETEIEIDADVPAVRITREFDAPPAKVFRAHVDPDLLVRWLGPAARDDDRPLRLPDRRVLPLHPRRRDGEYASTARSTRCARTERIVQTFTFEGFPDGVSLDTLTLEDLGDGRTRLVGTSLLDSFEGATR